MEKLSLKRFSIEKLVSPWRNIDKAVISNINLCYEMKLNEIKDQKWSTLVADFYQCQNCLFIDRDSNRMIVGYNCPICNHQCDGATPYFHSIISDYVDTIQDIYHAEKTNSGSTKLFVIVMFCTLGEMLLDHFFIELMNSKGIPIGVQKRLLEDNLYVRERVFKLFPSLTNVKWKDALILLSEGKELNYTETVNFFLDVQEKRNHFIHRGKKYAIPVNLPKECIDNIWALICLFVGLHNEYIFNKIKRSS